jgi:hypothetical protein
LSPGAVAPLAEALYRERRLDFGRDNMQTRCIPRGPAYILSPYEETRILQTPTIIALLNNDMTHREIFMDGRQLEADPNPSWMGYSVGHWDGDTLTSKATAIPTARGRTATAIRTRKRYA